MIGAEFEAGAGSCLQGITLGDFIGDSWGGGVILSLEVELLFDLSNLGVICFGNLRGAMPDLVVWAFLALVGLGLE